MNEIEIKLEEMILYEIADYVKTYIADSNKIRDILCSDSKEDVSQLQSNIAIVSARIGYLHGKVKDFISKEFLNQKFIPGEKVNDKVAESKSEIEAERIYRITRRDLDRLLSALKGYSIVASSRLNVLIDETYQSKNIKV